MISYRTKRLHARSQINRIFSRVVFLERKLGVSVFSSLFMWGGTSPVGSDLEWQSQRKNHFEMGFPFVGVHLPRRNLSSLKTFCSLSWFPLLIGNPSFPFLFFPFHFFLSLFFRSLIGNSGFSLRYSLSLEEILLSSSSGGRMRILFMGQGSRELKVVSQHGLFTARARFWYLGQNKFMCQGVGFGLNSHIISTRRA